MNWITMKLCTPGYDEYRFDLDEIEHDPYVLISILTAFHEGVFYHRRGSGGAANAL